MNDYPRNQTIFIGGPSHGKRTDEENLSQETYHFRFVLSPDKEEQRSFYIAASLPNSDWKRLVLENWQYGGKFDCTPPENIAKIERKALKLSELKRNKKENQMKVAILIGELRKELLLLGATVSPGSELEVSIIKANGERIKVNPRNPSMSGRLLNT